MNLTGLRRRAAARAGCHWWIASRMDRDLRASSEFVKGDLLDVGCGAMPYRSILEPLVARYVGVDLPPRWEARLAASVVGSALALPFRAGSFDTVLCTQVLEHLSSPEQGMLEMGRVLRPDGYLIMTSPLMQAVHEAPRDYYRLTEYGLRYLADRGGLQVVRIVAQGGFWCMAGQNLNFWLWDRLAGSSLPIRATGQLLAGGAMRLFVALDRLMPEDRYTMNYISVYRKPGG